MDPHTALINPIMGEKPPEMGSRCVMIANSSDMSYLEKLSKAENKISRRLFMSRLVYGPDPNAVSFIGPFIGAPYAAILLESLIAWGVREVIFLGWCGAISPRVQIGDILIPNKALMDDGTSRNYLKIKASDVSPSASIQTDMNLFFPKNGFKIHNGAIWSTDAIYRETKEKVLYYQKKHALAVEMEAAALFAIGGFRKIDVGCLLIVSDELSTLKWQPGFKHSVFKEQRRRICEGILTFWKTP